MYEIGAVSHIMASGVGADEKISVMCCVVRVRRKERERSKATQDEKLTDSFHVGHIYRLRRLGLLEKLLVLLLGLEESILEKVGI